MAPYEGQKYKSNVTGKEIQFLVIQDVIPSFNKQGYYTVVWYRDLEIGENHCTLMFDFIKEFEVC